MSITPIPLSCLKKEHQNESKTFQYNLYECSYLLRVKKFKTDPENNVSDVDIVMSALYERNNCCLLVLVCSNGSLILYYKESSERPIIKQLNWFQNPSKRVVALCTDPVRGAWILCACVDGDGLYLIPVFPQIKESPKIVNVSPTWSLTDLSKIPFSKTLKGTPTAAIWWHTLDDRNIGIIGTESGEIIFLDISQQQEIGRAAIKQKIVNFDLLQDINAHFTQLYILTEKNWTLQLLLEQPTQNTEFNIPANLTQAFDMGYDTVTDCNIDSILVASKESKEEIRINNRVEVLPRDFQYSLHKLHDRFFIGKHDVKYQAFEVLSDIKRVPEYVYNVIPCVSEVLLCENFMFTVGNEKDKILLSLLSRQLCSTSLGQQGVKRVDSSRRTHVIQAFRLLPNEEVVDCYKITFHRPSKWQELFPHCEGYNDTSELSSFLVVSKDGLLECRPRISPEFYFTEIAIKNGSHIAEVIGVTLDLNISLLNEYIADKLITERDVHNAVKFYNLSKCSPVKRASRLVEFSSVTDGLIFIKQILKKQPMSLSTKDRKQLANMTILCYVEQALESQKTGTFSKNLAESFRSFICDNFNYDEHWAMDLLVTYGMLENVFDVAKTRGRVDDALEMLSSRGLFTLTQSVQDMLIDRGYADLLCRASNGVFINHMQPEDAAKFLLAQPNVTRTFIATLSKLLLKLEESTLLQIARVFDPSRQFIKPILERTDSIRRKRAGSGLSLTSMTSSLTSATSMDDPTIPASTDIIAMFLKTIIALNSRRKNADLPDLKLISRHLSSLTSWSGSIYKHSDSMGSNELLISDMAKVKLACGKHHTAFVTSEKELYTWGRASNGRLGHGDLVEEKATCPPMRVESLHMHGIQVISVSCGVFHTVALCQEGVFSWGGNKYGQLGLGDTRKRSRPALLADLSSKQINSVVCGHYHTLAVTNDYNVSSWGWGVHGQLGLKSTENQLTPQPIISLQKFRIIQASAGYAHTAVLTSQGHVYTFGAGLYGQLGNGGNAKYTLPQLVSSLLTDNIYIIACGAFETLAVSDEQTIFCWGRNHHQFHICGKAENASYGRQMASKTNDISHRYLPEDLPFKLQQPIMQLWCGNWHYMALTTMNYLYTWGCNDCGQLGHYNKMEQAAPRLIKALSRRTITAVAAGSEFSVAVDSEDQVLAWGRADGGLIGIENENTHPSPVARRSIYSVLAPTVVPGLPIHFDQVSLDSDTQSIKREFLFDQNYDLPDLSTVGHDQAPYSCEAVLLSLYKLTGLYNIHVLTQSVGPVVCVSVDKMKLFCKYALHTEQWFVLSFCYELQEKWDKAFVYRARSIRNYCNRTGKPQLYPEKLVLIVADFLNKFEDNIAEDYEEDTSFVAMVSCLCHVFDYWLEDNFSFQRLEDLLRKHMESLCPLYTIVFFGFLGTPAAAQQVSLRFALYKVTKQHAAVRFLSKNFFINLLNQVSNQMNLGTSWYAFLSSRSSVLNVDENKGVCAPVEETTLSRDQMLKEIVEHKRKVLGSRHYISLSNAVAATLAAASAAHRAESSGDGRFFLQNTDSEDYGDKQPDSAVFSCNHNLPRYYMLETVIPEFQSRMSELPEPLNSTADAMSKFYKQSEFCVPLACPYCVYNNLRNEQLQVLRENGADLLNDRSSLWEI